VPCTGRRARRRDGTCGRVCTPRAPRALTAVRWPRARRHVSSIQKARIDASIRHAAHAKYSRVGPDASSVQSGIVPVIIEVPRDQRNKLEYDKDTDSLMLDRVLHSSCHYPGDYGFVPRTLCPDGDPIDVLVLSKFPLTPGVVAECRVCISSTQCM